MKELFKSLKKMATSFLAMCLIVSMLPIQVFAETAATDENITVAVSVENNTFLEDQGDGEPAFTGKLFNTKVEVPEGSTAFDALEAALKKENIEYL